MLEAFLPYISAPELTLAEDVPVFGKLVLKSFGPMVVAALLIGRSRCVDYARRKDLDVTVYRQYLTWMLFIGFVISHWVSALLYYPDKVAEHPWVILHFWNGLSSIGGFLGIYVAGLVFGRVYCSRKPMGAQPLLVFFDTTLFGLLAGWCFGRGACTLVHDHPGRVVAEGTFLALGPWPDGTWRHDLGLLELMFTVVLMVLVYFVARWDRWPPGKLTGVVLTVYAPARFFLDTMRAQTSGRGVAPADARYLSLTPAQWFMIVFFVVGVWLLWFRKPKDSDLSYAKESDRLRREQEAKAGDETCAAPP